MTKFGKLTEAVRLTNRIHGQYTEAILNNREPDWTLIEQLKNIIQEAAHTVDYTNCIYCDCQLEVGKSKYHRFFLFQHNASCEKGELNVTLDQTKKELVFCEKCSKPIIKFLSNTKE